MHPRNSLSLLSRVVVVASVAFLATAAHAADIDAGCRTMMNKLATQYESLQKALGGNASTADRRSRIDAAVAAAYGTRKSEVESKWPGLFDWSISELDKGLLYSVPAVKFPQQAYADCLMKFDSHAD